MADNESTDQRLAMLPVLRRQRGYAKVQDMLKERLGEKEGRALRRDPDMSRLLHKLVNRALEIMIESLEHDTDRWGYVCTCGAGVKYGSGSCPSCGKTSRNGDSDGMLIVFRPVPSGEMW